MKLKKKYIVKYWDSFYNKKNILSKPSNFAIYTLKYLKNYQNIIFDIGCGNGRDTAFFNKKNIKIIGLDISNEVIKQNKKKNKKKKLKFIRTNFCKYFHKKIKDKFSIYSRFTMHTINHKEEEIFFQSIFKQPNLEYLFIETRTTDDELFGVGKKIGKNEYFSDHYRRFIIPGNLKKLLKKKFKIIVFKQSKNFARYRNYKPNILRIVAKKIN